MQPPLQLPSEHHPTPRQDPAVKDDLDDRVRHRRGCTEQPSRLGKSQEQLADDIGLHWSYLGQVERGVRNLALHNILRIAEGLGVDPGELVMGLKAPQEESG